MKQGISYRSKIEASLLNGLAKGTNVAVVTLFGSLCPITIGHVNAFIEARKMLLEGENEKLEDFGLVLGFISLNSDAYVGRKFKNGCSPLDIDQRTELVRLAIADLSWIDLEEFEGITMFTLQRKWPHLHFTHFTMNGADDVVKYKKWRLAGPSERFITMGRPGYTQKLVEAMGKSKVNHSHFLVGPELPDISSTKARDALERGDYKSLHKLLDLRVLEWLKEYGSWSRQNH